MARKTKTFIATNGRDEGKEFEITEMSAMAAEDWAMRALMGVVKASEGNLPDIEGLLSQGMAGLAVVAAQHLGMLDVSLARELRDELMSCVKFVARMPNNQTFKRGVTQDDVEEVATLLELRKDVIMLHIGFFTDETASTPG